MWKENILENLEVGVFEIAEEFLANLRKKFGRKDKEVAKVAELK